MTFFLPYYVAALALLYFELRGAWPRPVRLPRLPAVLWVAGLLASYAIQLSLVRAAAAQGVPGEPWRASLPIGVAVHGVAHGGAIAAALLALTAFQSLALVALYRDPPKRLLVWTGAAATLLFSVFAPAFVSPDPYAYVGDALLGRAAYAPPAANFTGEFGAINHLFAAPMLPSPYGPVAILAMQLATAPFASLLGKLLALRLLGAGCVLALLAALRAWGAPRRVLAIVALNPGIALQYVACAHNDLIGIVPLVAAAAVVGAAPLAACSLIALAGAVKLPFVLLGLPVLAAIRARVARYAYAALAIAAALAVSWYAAGAGYFQGLVVHVPAPGPVYAVNLIVTLLAVLALAVAFLGGPRLRSAVWLIPMASSYVASWYLIYGLPYALARRRILVYLLVAFPFADVLVDAKFMQWWTYAIVLPVVVLLGVVRRK